MSNATAYALASLEARLDTFLATGTWPERPSNPYLPDKETA